MSFSQLNLNSNIYKAIAVCGYTQPTPVQAKSIPEVLSGRDVVVSAQTGTGKTAAFVLPALHRLSAQQPSKKPRVLILTPTRELASQITKAASLYGKFLKFNIVSLVGGMPYHHQIKDLARGADILVATPGRLMDHMEQKRVDLSHVEMLVLDEADRMLDMGFIEDVQYIAKLTPSNRQTLLFSATLDSKLMHVVRHLLKTPVRIDLSSEKIAAPQIKQEMVKVNNAGQKARVLKHFLNDQSIYKAIIFSATKINADKLANQLRDDGFAAAALHGDLRQNVRNRTLDQLRKGKIQFLVATDVAARGIDVIDITHVINYDLPKFCEDYVHRIGRTGRAGKTGVAISFVLPTDVRHLQRIEKYIGQHIKPAAPINMDELITAKHLSRETQSIEKKEKTGENVRQRSQRQGKQNDQRQSKQNDHQRQGNDQRQGKQNDQRFVKKKKFSSKKKTWKNKGSHNKSASNEVQKPFKNRMKKRMQEKRARREA